MDVDVSATDLEAVLQGVAASTQAPGHMKQKLLEWFHNEQSHARTRDLPTQEWRRLMTTDNTRIFNNDTKQLFQVTLAIAVLRQLSRNQLQASSEDLDLIWGLIHGALTDSTLNTVKFRVTRSSQGFMNVPLCSLIADGKIDELFRFHIWLPDGKRGDQDTSIHSHQPFAQSWILAGEGTDLTYLVEPTKDAALATHAEYLPHWDDGKGFGAAYKSAHSRSTLVNTGRFVRARELRRVTNRRDQSYTIPSAAYHSSSVPSNALHATLFYFDSSRGFVKGAGVLGPVSGQRLGDFVKVRDADDVTAAQLAEMADSARYGRGSRAAAAG